MATIAELRSRAAEVAQRLLALRGYLDVPSKKARIDELEHMSAEPGFWDDQATAQGLLKERQDMVSAVETLEGFERTTEDALELLELADMEDDDSLLLDIESQVSGLEAELDRAEFQRMMTSSNDRSSALVQINAGAGGTESCDWASMLLRMYTRWAEREGFKVSMVDFLAGEEAGIKSALFQVTGNFAFGFLKAENGVHRLVRISPFDSQSRRHTSFASVFVLPEQDNEINIEINPADLRIDTYRASGAGGQHVNRTDSAVRITHNPTGVVVSCQAERSQHKNRDKAMKVLAARLADLERKSRNAERDEIEAAKKGINFGSQIRSYVLQPYRMVKDVRTGHETSNTDAVLNGDLDGFIKAWLMKNAESAA
ncbi:MAG: peptide chain release factor 2 [Myxococcales bacterium]|nr:peptide chain release factor 2 [Myxococcales bacterium]